MEMVLSSFQLSPLWLGSYCYYFFWLGSLHFFSESLHVFICNKKNLMFNNEETNLCYLGAKRSWASGRSCLVLNENLSIFDLFKEGFNVFVGILQCS